MKKQFPGYYNPTASELRKLWEHSLLVFDADVLLSFYRCSEETAQTCLYLLEKSRSRLWLPYRAAEEYHENLDLFIEREEMICGLALTSLDFFSNYYRHIRGIFFTDPMLERHLQRFLAALEKHYSKKREQLRRCFLHNPVKDKIAELFEGRVGKPLSSVRPEEIHAFAEERFRRRWPPLPDSPDETDPASKNGGLVLWLQVLERVETLRQPLLFISGETNRRWFSPSRGEEAPSPHPFLVAELKTRKNILFHICTFHQYLSRAGTLSKSAIKQSVIEEAALAFREARAAWEYGLRLAELMLAPGGGQGRLPPERGKEREAGPTTEVPPERADVDQAALKNLNNLLKYYSSEGALFRQAAELLKHYRVGWPNQGAFGIDPEDTTGGEEGE